MNYAEQIKQQLYAKVFYPPELTEALRLVGFWRDFCGLPQESKMAFAYPNHQVGVKDPGYKERERAKGREDKWYFHYTGQNDEMLAAYQLAERVNQDPLLRSFFQFIKEVYAHAQGLALDIARQMDAVVPGLEQEITAGKNEMVLRLLYYRPLQPQDMSLADPHIDRSGFTLHLYESHPGLELLDWQGNWQPAPMGAGHTIVFGAWQLQQKSNQSLPATWHRVRRLPGVNDVTPRISLVFFVPFVQTPSYPKDDRFQSLVPGYRSVLA